MTQDAQGPRDNWKEIKSKIEGLGLKLKLHIDQERGNVADDVNGDANDDVNNDSGDDAKDTASDTRAAVEDLGEKIQEAFAGFTGASKDPAVKADLKEIGAMLKDVMTETLSTVGHDVGEKVGDKFKKTGSKDSSGASDTDEKP